MADPQRALDTTRAFNPYTETGPIEWELPTDKPAAAPASPVTPVQAPGALQTTPPPGLTPEVKPQPEFDDESEYQASLKQEADLYKKNLLDADGRQPLLGGLSPEQHPEWSKLQEAKQLFSQLTNPKEMKAFEPRIRALERKVQVDMQAQERRVRQQHTEELRRLDAPREDVKKRDETAGIMGQHIDSFAAEIANNKASRDPATARKADFDIATSPLTTMAKKKPDDTMDYTPLRNAVTSIATYNRNLPNEMAVKYALAIGSPVGTDEKGQPVPGQNGIKGKGATSYKVLGQDARGNYLLEFPDQKVLRVPSDTYYALGQARTAGYAQMKKWEQAQAEAAKPGLIERTMKRIIPEKGF
jgi:hypothetical protein